MTCIAGIAQGGRVWLGCDGITVEGDARWIGAAPKVFRRGEFIFGFAGSYRIGDVLHHVLEIPKQPDNENDERWLHVTFVPHVRATFAEAGFLQNKNEVESLPECGILFGYRGVLHWLERDFHIGSPADGIGACGSGGDYARAAMYALPRLAPRARIHRALEIAERCSITVSAPFKVISL